MPRRKHEKRKPSRLGHVPVFIQRFDDTGAGVGIIIESPTVEQLKLPPSGLHVVDSTENLPVVRDVMGPGADVDRVRVPGTLPGEIVEAEVVHVQMDGLAHGVLSAVLRKGNDRVEAECPHFLTCGGCDFLHVSDPVQRHLKRNWVADALEISLDTVDEVLYAQGGYRNLAYRTLAKLVVGPDRVLGSYRPRTHDVVDMSGCLVHAPPVERVAERLRHLVKAHVGELDLRYILIRASLSESRSVVTFISRTSAAPGVRAIADALRDFEDVAKCALHINDTEGDGLIVDGPFEMLWETGPVMETMEAAVQAVEPGAFLQVNPKAAELLYQRIAQVLEPEERSILDLYAGSGAISAALLARNAASVLAVETAASAATAARFALSDWSSRFQMRQDTVARVLETLEPGDFQAAVLNPPRKGAGADVMHLLAGLMVDDIVYVSCNPATLAKDLAVLTKDDAYRLVSVTPLDMFPQTRHVETIVVLERVRAA